MPRIKLTLPRPLTPWTKVPNHLIQTLLPTLTDTELRLLLILLRQTTGWNKPESTVTLPYRRLMQWTGRSSETVWKAVQSLRAKGLIHSPKARTIQRLNDSVSESEQQQYKDSLQIEQRPGQSCPQHAADQASLARGIGKEGQVLA